jgi:hypothetical protein
MLVIAMEIITQLLSIIISRIITIKYHSVLLWNNFNFIGVAHFEGQGMCCRQLNRHRQSSLILTAMDFFGNTRSFFWQH